MELADLSAKKRSLSHEGGPLESVELRKETALSLTITLLLHQYSYLFLLVRLIDRDHLDHSLSLVKGSPPPALTRKVYLLLLHPVLVVILKNLLHHALRHTHTYSILDYHNNLCNLHEYAYMLTLLSLSLSLHSHP